MIIKSLLGTWEKEEKVLACVHMFHCGVQAWPELEDLICFGRCVVCSKNMVQSWNTTYQGKLARPIIYTRQTEHYRQ